MLYPQDSDKAWSIPMVKEILFSSPLSTVERHVYDRFCIDFSSPPRYGVLFTYVEAHVAVCIQNHDPQRRIEVERLTYGYGLTQHVSQAEHNDNSGTYTVVLGTTTPTEFERIIGSPFIVNNPTY